MVLKWLPITGPAGPGSPDALYVGGTEVARMVERLDGSWFAVLRYPDREAVQRPCTSYEAGRAGCETWASRHRVALEAHAERRHLTWLAKQTWRGLDSVIARRRLEELDRQAPAAPASLQGPAWLDCLRVGERGRPGDSRGRSGSLGHAPYVAGGPQHVLVA